MVEDQAREPVDIEAFRAEMREAGIEEVVPLTLDTYRDEATENSERLEAAMAGSDTAGIAKAAHAMKSAAGVIKARELAGLLQRLESAGHDDDLSKARALIDPVRLQAGQVLGYLERAAEADYRLA